MTLSSPIRETEPVDSHPQEAACLQSNGLDIVQGDPWLEPFREPLRMRHARLQQRIREWEPSGGLRGSISLAHRHFGFHRAEKENRVGTWYREWAPGARALYLIGDFNDWNRSTHPLERSSNGVWSIFVPDDPDGIGLAHGSRVKAHVVSAEGSGKDRIPAFAKRTVQDERGDFSAQIWFPKVPYEFRHPRPLSGKSHPGGLRIYEVHVGMAQEEGKVGQFREFSERILPRIAALGYNAIQLMAIQEHPYYGSFGYHVSSFYAVSSRFGTPEELQSLIDRAHGLGIAVFLDLVHSHAVKNTLEGLNHWDGTDQQYFHGGERGEHVAWDSKLFNYRKPEVLGFLLSNVRYWLEDFHFDGFRFDGVTSMLYLDHGLGRTFGGYSDYFGANVDEDALTYLKLANLLAHEINPDTITVAEDVSGMPGAARPVAEGGLGFDFRLAMGVPDYWIRILKEKRDEEWDLSELWHTLLNRRRNEKHVGYAESHDQSLVGDQTLAFRLMDQEMYWKMSRKDSSAAIDRGIALHKLIRSLSFSLAGEAWLNFIGNEFGHPDWVDFPRDGNGFSYQHARRQWSLVDDGNLRYRGLLEFDRALQRLDQDHELLESRDIELLLLDQARLLLVYRRGEVVFAFNFHPTRSLTDLRIPVAVASDHRVVLDSDELGFEGFGRVRHGMNYPWQPVSSNGKTQSLQIYLPARSCQALVPVLFVP